MGTCNKYFGCIHEYHVIYYIKSMFYRPTYYPPTVTKIYGSYCANYLFSSLSYPLEDTKNPSN